MKVIKLDHIGIAVKNMDEALAFYRDTLGISSVFLPLGDTELELLESTSPDGPVAKFIEKRGEGIQHVALRVENIEEALKELKEKDVRLIDQTGGILLEISERE